MNLIICHTPLQVLIAEKIMAKFPNEDFYGVMFTKSFNEKNIRYFERIQEKLKKNSLIYTDIESSKISFFLVLSQINSNFLECSSYDKVFLANINSLWVQKYLSQIKFKEIYTFDDGLANIIKNSPLLYVTNRIKFKIINFFIGNKLFTPKLLSLSKKHFTIYPNFKNIIENTEYIDLWKNNQNRNNITDKRINIFVGQPIFDNDQDNINLINKVREKISFDKYFPHPAEKYKIPNIDYIHTDLIFEDYISTIDNEEIIIYTFFSSVIINLMDIPYIKTRFIKLELEENVGKNKWLRKSLTDSYKLFSDNGLIPYKIIKYRG